MKRPTETQQATAKINGHPDKAFTKAYPTIHQYLVDDVWDDGKPRETSAISFTVKEGAWQCALNDKALKASMYTAAPTLQEALELMEAALKAGTAGWRPWKRGK